MTTRTGPRRAPAHPRDADTALPHPHRARASQPTAAATAQHGSSCPPLEPTLRRKEFR